MPPWGYVVWEVCLPYRIPKEPVKTTLITTARYHLREIGWRDDATINDLWLVTWHQNGGHVWRFSHFVGRICIALSTSSRLYCCDDSNVEIGCSRSQTWLGHSMSVLQKHKGAWNVIFQWPTSILSAYVTHVTKWRMVRWFCPLNFHM